MHLRNKITPNITVFCIYSLIRQCGISALEIFKSKTSLNADLFKFYIFGFICSYLKYFVLLNKQNKSFQLSIYKVNFIHLKIIQNLVFHSFCCVSEVELVIA